MTLELLDQQLIASIQDGLELSSKPFAKIAAQLGISEQKVLKRLEQLKDDGTIKRLGVVVRHRELGFKANAMVVWDIPEHRVSDVAQRIASFDCVTLCYQRPRRLPEWSYNLFSMIHGKDRESVLQRLADLIDILELQDIKHKPLFSTKCFKQRGARYINPETIMSNSISPAITPLVPRPELSSQNSKDKIACNKQSFDSFNKEDDLELPITINQAYG